MSHHHPFRAASLEHGELQRVQRNLATLSAGLCQLTRQGDDFNAAALAGDVSGAGALAAVNQVFDREYCRIVEQHTPQLHDGSAYRAHSLAPAEINRIKQRVKELAAGVARLPGFGSRFDGAEMDRKVAHLERAGGPDALERINAEFEWEWHNILQVHATPPPRPSAQ
jgi:hypothetical protein